MKEENKMKKSMPRKGSEKGSRSTRRRKRDHHKHSSQTKRTMETTLGVKTNSPNPMRETEARLEFEQETLDVPNMMQSGGLQGTAGTKASTSEGIAELFEEGQDLEGELVQGVENARDADQGEIRTHEASREEAPVYRNRNRI
jgi:hypothetical protein